MTSSSRTPGPIADHAFDTGFRIAAVGGLACVCLLFLSGVLSPFDGTDVLMALLLFPIYLLTVATVLGVWLGYETDATDLERVTREIDVESKD